MCLTIPGKIKSIKKGIATVENGTRTEQIELGVVLDAQVGDWVLYASNRAVRLIDEQEAREIIELLEDNYQPVDVSALPQRYKQVIYKVRRDKFVGAENQKSKIKDQKDNSKLEDKKIKKSRNSKNEELLATDYSLLTKGDLEYLLNLQGGNNLEALYSEANVLRKETIKDFVCIHGIVEFSNYCQNNCLYCGIGREANIRRYRMSEAEIYMTVKNAVDNDGYKLVVLQSGEDFSYSDDELVSLINRIKKNIRVFVFISLGERSKDFYQKAYDAGASGSLFRFETSNAKLYKKMHPGHTLRQRLQCLEDQLKIGYYVASGGLIGLPGQTVSDLADDLLLVKKMGVPMLSSGPYISSSNNMLENRKSEILKSKQYHNSNTYRQNDVIPAKAGIQDATDGSQIPPNQRAGFDLGSIEMDSRRMFTPIICRGGNDKSIGQRLTTDDQLHLTLNYIAAARLLMPEIKIPITTALETLDPQNGRHKGLLAGANALMFNITPDKYRADYNLYDHKYFEREKVWQKYGLFKGEESYEMLEERLMI